MLTWALIFFIVAVIAGVFGFTNIAAGAAVIARFLFALFLIFFLIAVVAAIFVAA